MVGRKREWATLVRRLKSAFRGTSCKFIVLLGAYGIGKSFTLEKLYSRFKQNEIEEFKGTLVVRTTITGAPIRAMDSEPKPKFGLDFVTRLFFNIGLDQLQQIAKKVKIDDVPNINQNIRIIFNKLKAGDEECFSILTGEVASARDIKSFGLKSGIKDSSTALRYLFDFQRILKASGYDNFLVMLDEFEYVISTLGEKKITHVLNTFKEVFDQFSLSEGREPGRMTKIVFLFASSPGGWERLIRLVKTSEKKTGGGGIAPFYDRINSLDFITLAPFSLEDTKELIKSRLDIHRANKPPDPFFPFTNESIELIHELGERVPRKILEYCDILLEEAAEQGLKRITAMDAKKILEKFRLYPQKARTSEGK